jgi:hypothetical protein
MMKMKIFAPGLFLIMFSVFTLFGCAAHRPKAVVVKKPGGNKVVVVQKAPPARRTDVRPARPTARAVWIPGHWNWNGRNYVWKAGHWDRNPAGTAWVSGKWSKRGNGWVWVGGYWK